MPNGSEGAEHGEWKDGKGRTGPLTLRPSPSLTLLLSVLAHVHVTVDVT